MRISSFGLHRQVDVLLEDGRLVARVLVQADLADAEDVRPVEELGDQGDDLARQRDVLGLLGVDAQPAVVADAELGGPLRLDLGEVAEVIAEALGGAAIEAGPEGRLADGDAAALGHAVVVVGDAGDHVDVRVDVVHQTISGNFIPQGSDCLADTEQYPQALVGLPLVCALSPPPRQILETRGPLARLIWSDPVE